MEATIPPRIVTGPASVNLPTDIQGARFHLVGIGGCGMSGLAGVLAHSGARVSGTDCKSSAALDALRARGISVWTQQSAQSLPDDAQWVVASAAIPADHPELDAARRRGVPIVKYAQMLGVLMAMREGVAISGTHGKSTTTAWLTFLLKRAGRDPSFVVGADCAQLGGGSGVGAGPHFVVEACEYDRSFHHLRPRAAAILNIEEDHLDCYADIEAIGAAFARFAGLVPDDGLLVLNGDDEQCRRIAPRVRAVVETVGWGQDCRWRAADPDVVDGRFRFDLCRDGRSLGRVELGIAGRHNVANALAVTALAERLEVGWDAIRAGLREFGGVRRRLEHVGEAGGVTVVDDYAHHPTEIRATLEAARARFRPRRLWCVFQPHQHSRTRCLLEDFARSFQHADAVVVPPIYFVRDSERERDAVSAADLVERIRRRGGDAEHIAEFDDIVTHLSGRVAAGDVVLTMGAGDIWKVADELLRRLPRHLPS